MRAPSQLSRSAIEPHFWQLLAVSLLTFALGSALWYTNESSEWYSKHYRFDAGFAGAPAWWQIDLSASDVLELPISVPEEAPDGR